MFVHCKSVCRCNDGTPMSGANCKSDGGLECESCNPGFKLRQDKTACDGVLLMRGVKVTGMLDACSCFVAGMDVQRFGIFMFHVCVCTYALWCVGRSKNKENTSVCFRADCAVPQATSYSSGCAVSGCKSGWKVSDDKTKCVINVCSCPNGVGATGGACTVDGSNMCESCNGGFKLRQDRTTCDGALLVRGDIYGDENVGFVH